MVHDTEERAILYGITEMIKLMSIPGDSELPFR